MRLLHERKDVLNLGGVLDLIEDACNRKAAGNPQARILFVSPELYHFALLEIDMPISTVSCGIFSIITSVSLTGVFMR